MRCMSATCILVQSGRLARHQLAECWAEIQQLLKAQAQVAQRVGPVDTHVGLPFLRGRQLKFSNI